MTTGDLSVLLDRIENVQGNLGRAAFMESLQPGIAAGTVRSLLADAGLQSTRELEELYGWRNGVTTDNRAAIGEITIYPGFFMRALGDALLDYRALVVDPRWSPSWFPFLTDAGGDFYFVDLQGSENQPVRRFRLVEAEHPVEYESLTSFTATLCEAYERKLFFIEQGKYLDMDDYAFNDLAAELNPAVDWWQN
ncbi:cell wall assembly regulator SMI1 [Salinibacterium amurskyense]|uniref:Cell wall assembly regulator SMI1 n=1 Tax=Salinibacterium amurskyense TaxID=205941 RepID=A0A2M9D2T9_9MICO|nr:SMI1/KNR4 family protein [Salinibacterium amurskyense]PJJ78507.1 cell wall assembly regulator SMI1 [Salinibacterium amurskyense]RLQ80601.1 hypothetical protein D9C83_10330 [Salinibacterium amurskyense]GHD83115.1 cell wall assembly protein [Salinibacterium amurskyense]